MESKRISCHYLIFLSLSLPQEASLDHFFLNASSHPHAMRILQTRLLVLYVLWHVEEPKTIVIWNTFCPPRANFHLLGVLPSPLRMPDIEGVMCLDLVE